MQLLSPCGIRPALVVNGRKERLTWILELVKMRKNIIGHKKKGVLLTR